MFPQRCRKTSYRKDLVRKFWVNFSCFFQNFRNIFFGLLKNLFRIFYVWSFKSHPNIFHKIFLVFYQIVFKVFCCFLTIFFWKFQKLFHSIYFLELFWPCDYLQIRKLILYHLKFSKTFPDCKIEIKFSQNVKGKTAVLFPICDEKSTNQRREQKCYIFVTDVTYSKICLQIVTIFCHIVVRIIFPLCDNVLPHGSMFNFVTLWHFNAILWQ